MARTWTIYEITCRVNGKIYIGQTNKSVQHRWKKHCESTSGCTFLRNAIQKHGKDAFAIDALVLCKSKQEADELERFLIRDLRTYDRLVGYNLTLGGDGNSKDACHRGHTGEARGNDPSGCKTCQREYKATWLVEKNKDPAYVEAQRLRSQKSRARDPEKKREEGRSWRRRNPEKVSEQTRSWRERNPEKWQAQARRAAAKLRATPEKRALTNLKKRNAWRLARLNLKAQLEDFSWSVFSG